MDMFLQHVNAVPERPSRLALEIPVWLDTLVCHLLEKKPEQRPFDAAMVSRALNQVAEKVAAQQSAGLEVVRARRGNRPAGDGSARDTDKAARTLLTSMHRGRRKRRTRPLYEKVWFQAAGISILLLLLGGAVYLAFRPPSAEKLFAQAQRLMEGNKPEQVAQARDGPIKDYLEYHGDRSDAQAKQIREWADRYDVALREQQLENRYRLKISTDEEAEMQARRALHCEEGGDWSGAREHWGQAAKLKTNTDRDQRVWGLLAGKRLQDLATALAFEKELLKQVPTYSLNLDDFKTIWIRAVKQGTAVSPDIDLGPALQQAHKAVRYELFGDAAAARANWQQLKEKSAKEMQQRVWFLLAAKRLLELNNSMPATTKEVETKARLQHIKDALDEARRLAAEKRPEEYLHARRICGDILDLYHEYPDFRDSPEPGLKELVQQAAILADQLAQGEQKR
jgi:hypothetical protein